MKEKKESLATNLNRTAFGGTDSGNQDAGRGGNARSASHFALERRQFARDALLRLEGVFKVALGLATLSLLATHLLFSFVQLAFKSLSNKKKLMSKENKN